MAAVTALQIVAVKYVKSIENRIVLQQESAKADD